MTEEQMEILLPDEDPTKSNTHCEEPTLIDLVYAHVELEKKMSGLEKDFSKTVKDQIKFNGDMKFFKSQTSIDLQSIKEDVQTIKDNIAELRQIIGKFNSDVSQVIEFNRKVAVSLNLIRGQEKRESQGGSITEIQHQDLILEFTRLINQCDSLSIEIIPKKKNLEQRCIVKSAIAIVFTGIEDFESWFNDILLSGDIEQNEQKKSDDSIRGRFRKFYDEVRIFLIDLAKVKPEGRMLVTQIGNLFDSEKEEIVNDQCSIELPVTIVVYPGYLSGDEVKKKAKVFTSA